jgi:molybdate transport system substrate-binding protein
MSHKSLSISFSLLLILVFALGCRAQVTSTSTQAAREPVELTVFAAASLAEAFTEIGQQFQAEHPGATVTFNFAGSQDLAQQLGQGAPADVFASANNTQMNVAIEAGRIVSGAQQTFARNRLVVIYPGDNPAQLTSLIDLAKPCDKCFVLADESVPVGQYSIQFLDKASADPAFGATFKEDVLKNVASYEQNVRAVLSKVVLGEAYAGIVYTSDITGDGASQVGRIDIPDALNTIASYPIAAVSDSAHAQLAQAFVDDVLGPAGQDILAQYGFIPVR